MSAFTILAVIIAWGLPVFFMFLIVDCLSHINRRLAELTRALDTRSPFAPGDPRSVIAGGRVGKEPHPHG